MQDRPPVRLAMLLIAGLGFMGCASSEPPPEHTRTASHKVHDATITASVKVALAFKPGVAATDINVDTSDGVVTLHGLVGTEAERQLAAEVAEDVSDVTSVVNDIEIR